MTDRELLEMAAKAAGVDIQNASGAAWCAKTWEPWNPLTDDGDALRLAVKLHIHFKAYATTVRTWAGDPVAQRVLASAEELCGDDPYAATRRAIVRAAAEIGKTQ